MRNLVERLVLLSFAGLVACTGGQGGDPGQTGNPTSGNGGDGSAGQGSGGIGGGGGAAGSTAGSGGSAGCTSEVDGGVGILSAELDSDVPRLEETVALPDEQSLDLARFGRDLVSIGVDSFWLIEPGASARAHRVETGRTLSMALPFDLDGDGDDDVVALEQEGGPRVRLWERDGEDFIEHDGYRLVDSHWRDALTAGDVDGDGDLDIVTLDAEQPHVMLNEGQFEFTRIDGSSDLGDCAQCTPNAVRLRDLDGDGALDLVAIVRLLQGGGYRVWISVQYGDGTGMFGETALTEVFDDHAGNRFLYADINHDSHFDFVMTHQVSSSETYVVYGAAEGAFLPAARLDYAIDDLVDVDDDGELDIVTVDKLDGLSVRYSRDGYRYAEQRYDVGYVRARSAVVLPARGGDAPSIHIMYRQECPSACSSDCGACVFGACAWCLNHDDCGSGFCGSFFGCTATPSVQDQDAGSEPEM